MEWQVLSFFPFAALVPSPKVARKISCLRFYCRSLLTSLSCLLTLYRALYMPRQLHDLCSCLPPPRFPALITSWPQLCYLMLLLILISYNFHPPRSVHLWPDQAYLNCLHKAPLYVLIVTVNWWMNNFMPYLGTIMHLWNTSIDVRKLRIQSTDSLRNNMSFQFAVNTSCQFRPGTTCFNTCNASLIIISLLSRSAHRLLDCMDSGGASWRNVA